MKILCPACSREKPLAIPITKRDKSVICPKCSRRYKLDTFLLEKHQSKKDPEGVRYLLNCHMGKRNRTITLFLQRSIPLKSGNSYTLVSRSGLPLGLADQEESVWVTLFPVHKPRKLLNKLSLVLTLPIIILTLIQATRIPTFLIEQQGSTFLWLLGIISVFIVAPFLFWLAKEVLRGNDRDRIIPGYHPEKDDI